MHWQHWGLTGDPLADVLDASAYVATPSQDEALARIDYLIQSGKRLGLVVGPSGCGKSLVLALATFAARRRGAYVARFSAVGLDGLGLFEQTLVGWQRLTIDAPTLDQAWREIDSVLAEGRHSGRGAIVLLDDAERLGESARRQLDRLVAIERARHTRLTIVLSGESSIWRTLELSLLEAIELRIDITPWSVEELEHYLTASLERHGRTAPTFEPRAIERLHGLTHGQVRKAQQLASLALVVAAGQQSARVDADAIDTAADELAVPESPTLELVGQRPRVEPVRF